jgi:hypothetical protein
VGVHRQLALDEVAAVAVVLVEPVAAVQFGDVSVEVDDVDAVFDFDAAVDVAPVPLDVVAVVAAVVPEAIQAPSTAVATRLAAPAVTRERAAGRRRRDRFGMGGTRGSCMGSIIRIRVKGRPNSCKSRARTRVPGLTWL